MLNQLADHISESKGVLFENKTFDHFVYCVFRILLFLVGIIITASVSVFEPLWVKVVVFLLVQSALRRFINGFYKLAAFLTRSEILSKLKKMDEGQIEILRMAYVPGFGDSLTVETKNGYSIEYVEPEQDLWLRKHAIRKAPRRPQRIRRFNRQK